MFIKEALIRIYRKDNRYKIFFRKVNVNNNRKYTLLARQEKRRQQKDRV